MDLRKALALGLTMGKIASSSENYRKAQKAAFAAGVHSSFNRRDRNEARRSRKGADGLTDREDTR
jgi:hypothetical protein